MSPRAGGALALADHSEAIAGYERLMSLYRDASLEEEARHARFSA
jgi:hypothetical protein